MDKAFCFVDTDDCVNEGQTVEEEVSFDTMKAHPLFRLVGLASTAKNALKPKRLNVTTPDEARCGDRNKLFVSEREPLLIHNLLNSAKPITHWFVSYKSVIS